MNLKLNIVLAALIFSPLVFSGATSSNAVIKSIMMDHNYPNKFFIETIPKSVNKPACAINPRWNFVIATDIEFNKQIISLLHAAKLSKGRVKLSGKDNCNVYPNVETLKRIEILD